MAPQWLTPPKKFKVVPSAGKVMATIFWNTKGILLIDYLDKGQTITGEYYASLLRQLRIKIKSKHCGKLSKGVLLLQHNAPVHNAHVATTTARECGYEIIPHPPYSPDLAPCDFYLFPNFKSDLAGRRHMSNSAVIEAVNAYFILFYAGVSCFACGRHSNLKFCKQRFYSIYLTQKKFR